MLSPYERTCVQLILAAFPLTEARTELAPGPPVDAPVWAELVEVAERHKLAPLLYAALKARGRQEEPPAAVAERLRLAFIRTNVANWLAYVELGRLLAQFEREQIPAVLLKGCALAVMLYGDPSLRPFGDLDLLIPHEAIVRARAVLEAQGYFSAPEMGSGYQQSFASEGDFARRGRQPAQVDLHWHLLEIGYYRARIPIEWFWARTVELRVEGQRALALAPEAELLYLAAHFVLHHHAERLIWSYDLALLLSRDREQMDWTEVVNAAAEFGLVQPLQTALAHVAECWGVTPPAPASARLSQVRAGWRQKLALMVITAPEPDLRFVLDGLSAGDRRAQWTYFWRTLFPAASYMRTRYQIQDMRLLPWYYVQRVAQSLFKLGRAALALMMHG